MNISDQNLAHALQLRFGAAPGEPDERQLAAIKGAIVRVHATGHTLTDSDWYEVMKRYCPTVGSWAYKGLDNSDLVTLLRLATRPEKS